jgi:hypothetical protein
LVIAAALLSIGIAISGALSSSAWAQAISKEDLDNPEFSGRTVAGDYENSEVGFEFQIPDNWSGVEAMGVSMVSPGGIKFTGNSSNDWMLWMAVERELLEAIVSSFGKSISRAELPRENIANSCQSEKFEYVTINGIELLHTVCTCQNEDRSTKMAIFAFLTEKHLVIFMYTGNASASYERNLAEFAGAIETLQVDSPVGIKDNLAELTGLESESYQVSAAGHNVQVKVDSTVAVSGLEFSEENKQVSFKAEASDRNGGFTSVSIDKVLEGPYAVTVDGEITEDFVIVNDSIANQSSIQIGHSYGAHEVVISGTNVVPEFPTAIYAIVLGLAGTILAFRSKLRTSSLQS